MMYSYLTKSLFIDMYSTQKLVDIKKEEKSVKKSRKSLLKRLRLKKQ